MYFNSVGNLIDPLAEIFGDDGEMLEEVCEELDLFFFRPNNRLLNPSPLYSSDVVKLYYANLYSGETHGNYSTKTLFERTK